MRFREIIGDYFVLPRWERWAILILLLICFLFIFLMSWADDHSISNREKAQLEKAFADFAKPVSALSGQHTVVAEKKNTRWIKKTEKQVSGFLTAFNPNTVSESELRSMGVAKGLAGRWSHYVEAGGKFKKPADVQKLYGMDSATFRRLQPYFLFPREETIENKTTGKAEVVIVDLNAADSAALVALPGIGAAMAQRIVSYRQALGGFYSISQLLDLKSMRQENYNRILERTELKLEHSRIRINQVQASELARHPYFRKGGMAGALVAYREKHGAYRTAADLKKCAMINEEIISRILPYISFE